MDKKTKDFKRLVKAYARYYRMNYTEALRTFQEGTNFASHAVEENIKTVKATLKDVQEKLEVLVEQQLPQEASTLAKNLKKDWVPENTGTMDDVVENLSFLWGKRVLVKGTPDGGRTELVQRLLQALPEKTRVVAFTPVGDYSTATTFPTLSELQAEVDRLSKLKSKPAVVAVVSDAKTLVFGKPQENQILVTVQSGTPATKDFDEVIEVQKRGKKFAVKWDKLGK